MSARTIALVTVLALAGIGASPAHADSAGPGCASGRPAVAYHAGGAEVAQAQVPFPCATETGYYTGETTIGVTGAGTVWFSAADWEWALVRTRDAGANWERVVVPGPQAYPGCGIGTSGFTECDDSEDSKYNTVADAFLYVDRDTSRVFWGKTYGYAVCSSLDYSDDGENWKPVTRFACPGGDYEKIASGPPPAGGAQPSGYPNVVYACANGPAPVFVAGPARVCFKSLDGGTSWSDAGVPPVPSPLAPGCLHFQEPQFVARDGTVYLPLNCGPASIMLAISHDEAQTWSYVSVPLGKAGNGAGVVGGVSGAVDDAGNVYMLWKGTDERPYLAVSKDGGKRWNGPLMAGAPGVTLSDEPPPHVAARQPGHVAIGYYGHGSDESKVNGYLAESFDATASDPVFYSAPVNDPADPIYFPTKGKNPRNDYLGVDIAKDGTPWAAFVKLRSANPDSQGYVQSTGLAGRLVFPPPPGLPAARGCIDRRKFTFRLHHAPGARVVRVKVYVNGKLRLRRHGRSIRKVTLRRLPKVRFRVRVVATQSTGSRLISTRTYRGCRKSRPRTRAHHH